MLDKVNALLVKVDVVISSLSVHVRIILVVSPILKDEFPNEPNVQTGASISDQ